VVCSLLSIASSVVCADTSARRSEAIPGRSTVSYHFVIPHPEIEVLELTYTCSFASSILTCLSKSLTRKCPFISFAVQKVNKTIKDLAIEKLMRKDFA
jgi:hypothetical protein